MKLFHVPLKLISALNLTNSDDHARLTNDVKAWEEDAVEDSKDKLKAMYAKLHKNPLVKLAMPFVYIFVMIRVKNALAPPSDDDFGFDN